MSKVLDTIEVTVEHNGEVLTLEVEITQWPTKGGHEDPPEGAHWRLAPPPATSHWSGQMAEALRIIDLRDEYKEAIQDQVNDYCAEREAPGREW